MSDPVFIRETSKPDDLIEVMRWLDYTVQEARLAGATFFRASVDADQPTKAILEGWAAKPTDQGAIRWEPGA